MAAAAVAAEEAAAKKGKKVEHTPDYRNPPSITESPLLRNR